MASSSKCEPGRLEWLQDITNGWDTSRNVVLVHLKHTPQKEIRQRVESPHKDQREIRQCVESPHKDHSVSHFDSHWTLEAHPAEAHPAEAHLAEAHPAEAHPEEAHPAEAHPSSSSDVLNISEDDFAKAFISNQPIFQLVNQPYMGRGRSDNDGSEMMEKLLAAVKIVNETQVMVDQLFQVQDTKMTSNSQELSAIKELQRNLIDNVQEYMAADTDRVESLESSLHGLKEEVEVLQESVNHQADSAWVADMSSSVQRLQEQISSLQVTIENNIVCPLPYFILVNRCFSFHLEERKNWEDARQTCKRQGGDLANPFNTSQLIEEIRSITQVGVWMGAIDRESEGSWVTLSGQPIPSTFTLWRDGEPNNKSDEDCMEVGGDRSDYNDISCDRELSFVCEFFIKSLVGRVAGPDPAVCPHSLDSSHGTMTPLVWPSSLLTATIALLVCGASAVDLQRFSGVDCADVFANQKEILRTLNGIKEQITQALPSDNVGGAEVGLASIWLAVSTTRASVDQLARDHLQEIDRIKQTLSEVRLLQLEMARALPNTFPTPSTLLLASAHDEATGDSDSVLASSSSPSTEPRTEATPVAQPPSGHNDNSSCSSISCPVLFFALGSQCFYINTRDELTWDAAREWCREKGGDLADPLDPRSLIDKLIELAPEGKYWLGATDREHEGKWLGVSGRLVDMTPKLWEKNEPNNYNGNEHCLEVGFFEDVFNDIHCDAEMKFVCEHPPI
ncbi:uncharacterized protein [Panulirus ornatus]|uniref:uncharacterized protein n=1 Tax=Panulirus ornatus TaxID=150431 RepID=UPI003A880C4F